MTSRFLHFISLSILVIFIVVDELYDIFSTLRIVNQCKYHATYVTYVRMLLCYIRNIYNVTNVTYATLQNIYNIACNKVYHMLHSVKYVT